MRISLPAKLLFLLAIATVVTIPALNVAADADNDKRLDSRAHPSQSDTAVLLDISNTEDGIRVRNAVAQRRDQNGIPTDVDTMVTYRVGGKNDYLVVPSYISDVDARQLISSDGSTAVLGGRIQIPLTSGTQPVTSFRSISGGKSFVSMSTSFTSYWSLDATDCISRLNGDWNSWMDTCWQIHHLVEDGSPDVEYYQLHLYASFESADAYMDYAWVESDDHPSLGGVQSWVDWDPGSDSSGSCSSTTI